ncbi:GAF domain-containing protein [Ramlibacter sp. AN1015]|uniref:GAF domain-containing protein n=1 Tax=Ramlibacter sp. AN1015 TaxID=3133428 RepID=UPI0030C60BB5
MQVELASIRACFEGGAPSSLASADADGLPNVVIVSQVEYVDPTHLALSFQFFNKTRRNILANPHVQLMVVHPQTAEQFRITARYLHTQSEGPLFERMKAKLAGIASHTGMGAVFKLRGADLYEVQDVERVPTGALAPPVPAPNRLPALRRAVERLGTSGDLEDLFDRCMQAVVQDFGVRHAMLLLPDAPRQRLYTVASAGYAHSGVGSEVAVGDGVIGVAAQARSPIRINFMTQDTAYCRAVRDGLEGEGGAPMDREIAYPGLPQPHSQMALPVIGAGELLGLLFVESEEPMRFDGDFEDALAVFCGQLGAQLRLLQPTPDAAEEGLAQGDDALGGRAAGCSGEAGPSGAASQKTPSTSPLTGKAGDALRVRYFEGDCSVFLGDDYLIKGVAGAVLWTLLSEWAASGRVEFSNRELRLSDRLRLPDFNDNLEARLVLLRRRLAERSDAVRLEKAGRGRLRLVVRQPVHLSCVAR